MNNRNYWLHRISHCWEVSYPLLEQGYLSIGWSYIADGDILERIENNGQDGFNEFMKEEGAVSRSRWNLWRFSQFKVGDYVLVPLFDKKCCVYQVVDTIKHIGTLKNEKLVNKNNQSVQIDDKGIINPDTEEYYDIGYVIKVKAIRSIKEAIPRSYAKPSVVARMKIRQTNADIGDISDDVDELLKAEKPVDMHELMCDQIASIILEKIEKNVDPDKMEYLVKWYFDKKGAATQIPSKNECGKEDGADADVIATFDDLGIIFYVQVKKHEGTTNDWAVEQINKYKGQKENKEDDYTYISWVISSAENFNEDAKIKAQNANVRLIDGIEFSKMLLDVGFSNISGI